jgi:hypothetical protein
MKGGDLSETGKYVRGLVHERLAHADASIRVAIT